MVKYSGIKATDPKATTRPPSSLTADFLHPGHILSSRPRSRVMWGTSTWDCSWRGAASVGEAMEASMARSPRNDQNGERCYTERGEG